MPIKLNITNYNPDYENDNKTIQILEEVVEQLKNNINGKYYVPYKNLTKKMFKFIEMMNSVFEKEMDETKQKYKNDGDEDCDDDENINGNTNEDNIMNNDDDISIDSISDYEIDNEDEEENKQIMELQEILKQKMKKNENRFDFTFSKVP